MCEHEEGHVLALLCAAICRLGSTGWPRIVLPRFARFSEIHDLAVVRHRPSPHLSPARTHSLRHSRNTCNFF
jgi:hypothetical protein